MSDATQRHLMVVDDDEAARAFVTRVFEAEGWKVTEAPGGAHALAPLGSEPLPDVVLLDLLMPGLNGLDVLSKLRGQSGFEDLPIVVLCERNRPLASRLTVGLGADDVLSKPLDAAVLRARCGALADRTGLTARERLGWAGA